MDPLRGALAPLRLPDCRDLGNGTSFPHPSSSTTNIYQMSNTYRKHFLPLESNPEVFNDLIYRIGASNDLAFEDVFTLDDPELLPRPTVALILVFPTTPAYEARKVAAESSRLEYTGSGDGEPVVWFKQTINNACGMYAILHALSNGGCRQYLGERSPYWTTWEMKNFESACLT